MKNITVKRNAPSGPDFYPTPAWATEALLEAENFSGEVWECACGDGAMSKVLEAAGLRVHSTDLHYRNFGVPGIDFLKTYRPRTVNIITNPPFGQAEAFILHALTLAQKKVAIFSRLAILESARRYRNIFNDNPPTRVLVFAERVTLYPSGVVTGGTSTIAYCWLIWDKADTSARSEVRWIAPGGKPKSGSKQRKPPSNLTLADLGL